jgi:hypothetical protein
MQYLILCYDRFTLEMSFGNHITLSQAMRSCIASPIYSILFPSTFFKKLSPKWMLLQLLINFHDFFGVLGSCCWINVFPTKLYFF